MRTKEDAERRAQMVEEMAKVLYPLLPEVGDKEWDDLSPSMQGKAREAAEKALEARDAATPLWLRDDLSPRSPREACLMILAEVPPAEAGDYLIKRSSVTMVREIAQYGLRGHEDYNTSDALADRLAEAHDLLKLFLKATHEPTEVDRRRIAEALSLPPDLEAMVERRMKVHRGR